MNNHLRCIQDGSRDAASNMAVDEFLFQSEKQEAAATLRFYRFSEPAFTIGYAAWRSSRETLNVGFPVVRRYTGGGIVEHGADLTYSFLTRASLAPSLMHVRSSYAAVHQVLADSFQDFGIDVSLSKACEGKQNAFCFDAPVANDVLLGGRKLAGAGQRRSRGSFLHQGSIAWKLIEEVKPDLSESDFRARFARRMAEWLELPLVEVPLTTEELESATQSNNAVILSPPTKRRAKDLTSEILRFAQNDK